MKGTGTKFLRISYDLTPGMPVYAGNPTNRIEPLDSLKEGGSCNTFSITLFNHNGTHIDAPNHFDCDGRKICDYRIEDYIFNRPFLVDIPKKEGESISAEDLCFSGPQDCDILLVRTGFSRKRREMAYADCNPWLSPGAARFIRCHFNKLRAIGIDTISIGSHRHPAEAGDAHRILLQRGGFESDPLIVIEDLNLGDIENPVNKFFAIPLFISDVDSMPCTAFVEVSL
jgi:arylformamidase